MNRLIICLLVSSSFLYAMHNYTVLYEQPFTYFIEKKEYDALAQKVCSKAYAECPPLKGNERDYKCKFDYYQINNRVLLDIQLIYNEDDANPICTFQYDKQTKELRRID